MALLFAAPPLLADGGHIALHATSGPYTLTLFTAPDPLLTGPADLSVLVQDAETGAVLKNARVRGLLAGPLSGSTHDPGPAPGPFGGNDMLGMAGAREKGEPESCVLPWNTCSLTILVMTHTQATNALMLAASPHFTKAGDYQLTMTVTIPGSTSVTEFKTRLQVAENHQRRTALLFAILLPLAAILLFLVNQRAKQATVARG